MVEKYYGGGTALEIIRRCGCAPWEDPFGGGGIWIDFVRVGGPAGPPDDPDGDGIPTVIELWLGCNPNDDDSDGDGLLDRQEILRGTNPLDDDTDGDGLNDKREIDLGCDPLNPDTDGDGLTDGVDPAPLSGASLVVHDGGVPVRVSAPIRAVLTCTGAVVGAAIDWGDGSTSSGTSGVDTAHPYAGPGVYEVRGECTDATGGKQGQTYQYVVVFDPTGGFVTGGGWIDSPPGAYPQTPELIGAASFGFVSKYRKGATVPDGSTQFQFHAGDLSFHATAYEWLVVSGSTAAGQNAQFKGEGKIQGRTGVFKFMIWAYDGAKSGRIDEFRIRITDLTDRVVYDNGVKQALASGGIVVHTK